MSGPTLVSTFAGCGGSSLGYKWAGYEEKLAIDFDDNAVATFALNFPGVPVWKRDICEVSPKEVLAATGLEKGGLDLLDGSPPCQGFSTAGKRVISDSRNILFLEFVRFIKELEPRVFVMENVPGMTIGPMKGMFVWILRTLKETGYSVRVKKMNAKWYGVPQNRERIIFIGMRSGENPPFPEPGRKVITVREAFEGLPDLPGHTLGAATTLLWKRALPGTPFSNYHPKGHFFNLSKVHPDKPAPVILKHVSKTGYAGLAHWKYPRMLTIPELKRVSSFPDDFQFIGKFEEQWARIGNAVMPRFMYHIAKAIKERVFDAGKTA